MKLCELLTGDKRLYIYTIMMLEFGANVNMLPL